MKAYTEKILVVDTEDKIRQILSTRLPALGYTVFFATTNKNAITLFNKEKPNLVILDILLQKKIDCYKLCREIREISQIPIIILTALDCISDRIRGLELGADDYILKPFSPKELEAKIRSLLRRPYIQIKNRPKSRQHILNFGKLVIDIKNQQVFKNNSRLKLTTIEFSLLELFLYNAGRKLSRETILDNIWGFSPKRDIDTRIVDVNISRLRSKLEEDPRNPDLIITIRGTGYMFQKYL